jgi:MscS family membrane protein
MHAALLALLLVATMAIGHEPQPLKPADRSSPRAAIKTFLDAGDAFGAFLARDYLPSPSRSGATRLIQLAGEANKSLDLSEVPPAARTKAGYAAVTALYEVLNRVALPPAGEIPDADQFTPSGDGGAQRWIIPNTEIALVRMNKGPRSGEFLFSADTVARADEFYDRVNALPYARPVPFRDLHGVLSTAGGWMIPYSMIQALPAPLRASIAGQAAWKWAFLLLILAVLTLVLAITYRVARAADERSLLRQALTRLAMPAVVLAAMPVVEHLAVDQLTLVGSAGNAIEVVATAITFLAAAWMVWRIAAVVAEAIVASPRITPESAEAHLVRAGARVVGIVAATALFAAGADRIGIPLYGIVAGLGVGGLAVALAAQPTIENLIGGMSLLADRALGIGDLCKYGDAQGTVEAVGIRSTRMRGADRALTNIPNAVLAKMPIISLTRRDRMLIQIVLGLRQETSPAQLRNVLHALRGSLLADPCVDADSVRIRFVNLGDSSLDIEVFAYVKTKDWAEFLRIKEEILLRVMDIIEQAGTALAFPSQTLYLGRDRGTPSVKPDAVDANMRESGG